VAGIPLAQRPADASAWLHPMLLRGPQPVLPVLKQLNKEARRCGKPRIVMILHDEEIRYHPFPWLLILRTSMAASRRMANEWVLPYSWESRSEPFIPAPEAEKPGISFCGLANHWRQPLIDAFTDALELNADFIIRKQFWGGKPFDEGLVTDFWQNLAVHPFALAPRGEGNFSMRFYQALSIGRIPVVTHTDALWPLADRIPWKELIVEAPNAEAAVEMVRSCWNKGEVHARQERCYAYYHRYLAIDQFLPHQLPGMLSAWQRPWGWW
jgi:hypothetical protein